MGKRWIAEHIKDRYYRESKLLGYRSRAAFKLIQIQKKFKIFKPGYKVLDLCSAPGSWMQVAKEFVGTHGLVIGVDISPITPIENTKFLKVDIFDEKIIDKIFELTGGEKFNVIISDCSPKLTGIKSLDVARQISLVERAYEIAHLLLSKGGNFVAKFFQSNDFKNIETKIRKDLRKVFIHKPMASRKGSFEMFLIAKGFRVYNNSIHKQKHYKSKL